MLSIPLPLPLKWDEKNNNWDQVVRLAYHGGHPTPAWICDPLESYPMPKTS